MTSIPKNNPYSDIFRKCEIYKNYRIESLNIFEIWVEEKKVNNMMIIFYYENKNKKIIKILDSKKLKIASNFLICAGYNEKENVSFTEHLLLLILGYFKINKKYYFNSDMIQQLKDMLKKIKKDTIYDGLNQFFSYGFNDLIGRYNIEFIENFLIMFSNYLYDGIKEYKILYDENFERFFFNIENVYFNFNKNISTFYKVKSLIFFKNNNKNHLFYVIQNVYEDCEQKDLKYYVKREVDWSKYKKCFWSFEKNDQYYEIIVKKNLIKLIFTYLYSIFKKLCINTINENSVTNYWSKYNLDYYKKNENCFDQIDKVIQKINSFPGKL